MMMDSDAMKKKLLEAMDKKGVSMDAETKEVAQENKKKKPLKRDGLYDKAIVNMALKMAKRKS